MRETTRRELLRRTGLTAGALTLGSWTTLTSTGAATPTTRVALTPERCATYAALLDTVLQGPSMRLGGQAAEQAVGAFEATYVLWPADARRRADATLDALARDMRRSDRHDREGALAPAGIERQELELAERGLALVAVTVAHASDDELAKPEVTL